MMNKTTLIIGASLLSLSLFGCVAPQKATTAEQAVAYEPLVCASKTVCDVYWSRAQLWVANNSAWKIQTATDTVIQTFSGGSDYDRRTTYKVTMERRADGSAQIRIAPNCRLGGGCDPDPIRAAAAFKTFVKASN